MTGEITLRGRVLANWWSKRKIISSKKKRFKKVLIPIDNKKDLEDVPKSIKNNLEIITVSFVDDVIKNALVRKPKSLENIKTNLSDQIKSDKYPMITTAH